MAEAIKIREGEGKAKGWGVDMTIRLSDGRVLERTAESFPGCPDMPFSAERLWGKFRRLADDLDELQAMGLFDALQTIANAADVASAVLRHADSE